MRLVEVCLNRLENEELIPNMGPAQIKILRQLLRFDGVGFGELVLLTGFDSPKELSISLRPLLARNWVIFKNDQYHVACPWELLNELITIVEKNKKPKSMTKTIQEVRKELEPIKESLRQSPAQSLLLATSKG